MKYIRAKDGIYELMPNIEQHHKVSFDGKTIEPAYYTLDTDWIAKKDVIKQADSIEELCDEYVFFEKGNISIVSCLAEAKDRLLEYRDFDNYEPRLIGRIKVGLDVKAVAEFEEIKEGKNKGCYDWILL